MNESFLFIPISIYRVGFVQLLLSANECWLEFSSRCYWTSIRYIYNVHNSRAENGVTLNNDLSIPNRYLRYHTYFTFFFPANLIGGQFVIDDNERYIRADDITAQCLNQFIVYNSMLFLQYFFFLIQSLTRSLLILRTLYAYMYWKVCSLTFFTPCACFFSTWKFTIHWKVDDKSCLKLAWILVLIPKTRCTEQNVLIYICSS